MAEDNAVEMLFSFMPVAPACFSRAVQNNHVFVMALLAHFIFID